MNIFLPTKNNLRSGKIIRNTFLLAIVAPPILLFIQYYFFPSSPISLIGYWRVAAVETILIICVWLAAVQLKKLEAHISNERDKLEIIIQNMHDGLVVYDPQGKIVFTNPIVKEISGIKNFEGVSNGDILKHFVNEDGSDVEPHQAPMQKALNTKTIQKAIFKSKITGLWIALTSTPILDKNQIVLMVVTLSSDITDTKQLELSKTKTIEDKERFFNMVSHDLKTPLTSILLAASLVKRNCPPEASRQAEIIINSTKVLSKLIDDINTLTKLKAGKYHLEVHNAPVGAIVNDVLVMLSDCIGKKNINIINDTLNILCHCDPERLKQILLNLVGNAVKYSPEGGTITINAYQKDRRKCIFEVTDSGPGIPKDKLESIFDPYFQVNQEDGAKGTGLGLAIVKSLVESHGGKVWVESELGRGSKFMFILDIPDAEERLQLVPSSTESEKPKENIAQI